MIVFTRAGIRKTVIALFAMAFLFVGIAGALGAFINKTASAI